MNDKTKTIIKAASAGGLLVAAVALGISRLYHLTQTGEEGLQIWFYDQSERELYEVERDTLPPHKGTGGTPGDGVRAIVVACPSECNDPAKRRIAYLETYAPDLKKLQELRAAREAGRPYGKPVPSSESGFFETNTLVRRPEEKTWYDMTTREARRIMAEWRDWRGPDGASFVICTP